MSSFSRRINSGEPRKGQRRYRGIVRIINPICFVGCLIAIQLLMGSKDLQGDPPMSKVSRSVMVSSLPDSTSPCMHNETVLSEECMRTNAQSLARVFTSVSKDVWCVPSGGMMEHVKNEAGEFQGLLLYKVPKAASSTTAGLVFHLHHKTGGGAIQAKHFGEGPFEKKNTSLSTRGIPLSLLQFATPLLAT